MASKAAASSGNSRFVRRMIDSHSILGLTFAALIYVVSLTGAIVLFEAEIAVWENADAKAAVSTTPQAIEAGLNAMIAASSGPDAHSVFPGVMVPSEFQPLMIGYLNERAREDTDFEFKRFVVDPSTGQILRPFDAHFSEFLAFLHTDLHLPRPWGRYLVGLLGVCMFSLILSGIFAHPTILKDAFKLRLTSNTRMAWTDMHNRLSVWGLPFHMVLTFTGAFLGIAGIAVLAVAYVAYEGDTEAAVQAIRGATVIEGEALSGSIPVTQMIADIKMGDSQVASVFVDKPFSEGGVTRFNLNDPKLLAHGWSAQFRNTGEFLQTLGGKDAPSGMTAIGMIAPLHYGTFGGYGIKGLYVALSLALTYITSTGMMIWFRRRAQQGSPVPKTKAAWHAMTTGLSAGLAVGTLAAVAHLPVSMPLLVFPSWAIAGLLIYGLGGKERVIKSAYVMIGTVLTVAVAFHVPLALNAAAPIAGHVWALDSALIALALCHFWVGAGRDATMKKARTAQIVPAE